MNLNIAFYSIITLLLSVFGYNEVTPKVDSNIFSKSIETKDSFDTEHFNKTLDAYHDFYNNSCKHVKLKMGEVSVIEQRLNLESNDYNLELVYDERIQCEGNKLKMTVEIVDIFFYNKRHTKFEKLKSEDISNDSKRGAMLRRCKEDIKAKSEQLLTHLTPEARYSNR